MSLPVRRREGRVEQWSPLEELDRLVEGFVPMADIEESDDAFTIELELPGVKKDDISVEVSDRRVVVSGERKEKERVGILRRRTRSVGRFHYEVTLPGGVDDDAVEASLGEGVLTVRVPKAAGERPRRISIK